ncbi:tetratricopeptide repeat protein [Desulfohalobiaceae bacterium Ax17]|uniref:tetratricopeptide repeat protein n=1 Tax=Desulfovulcanus ferrireducens TaxID=2831190 RepID=UPI00207BA28F|nr:tetratricopeptide repeat protein [Desulfovulcanus ferrireducens]MBT8763511.1 tetratricopeptide repeat protein [Desulfovulcanus ferrireducens]
MAVANLHYRIKSVPLFFIVVLGIFLWGSLLPKQCAALIYYWGKHPQNERIVFKLDQKIPEFKLERTAKKQLTLFLPPDIWKKELKPTPVDLSFSRLVEKIIISKNGIEIITKHPNFGFITFNLAKEKKIVLDIFYDPLGAKWSPPQKPKETKRQKKSTSTTKTQPKSTPKPAPDSAQAHTPKTKPGAIKRKIQAKPKPPEQPEHNASTTPVSKPITPVPKPTKVTNATVSKTPSQLKKEVPYKLKAKIKRVPPDQAQTIRPRSAQEVKAPVETEKPSVPKEQPKSKTQVPVQQIPDTTAVPPNSSQATAPENTTTATTKTNQAPRGADQNATAQPDYQSMLTNIRAAIANGELDAAMETLAPLVSDPRLPEELKEEVLYTYADLLFQINHNNLKESFSQVVEAYERAINYDPKSPRLPSALLNLGYVHLAVGNIPEARAYFNLLRKKYPYDPDIPLTYFYWADFYFQKKDYQKAADEFQHIIQKYPDHRIAQQAAVGLAKSLKQLEFFKQALDIVEYIEQRWPRYYIDDPDFLILSGYVAYKNKKYDRAKDRF